MQGGGRQPHIVECKKIGNVYGEQYTGGNYGGNVWDENGLAPCFKSSGSSGQEFCLEVKKMEQQIVAMRGRDKDNPSDRTVGNPNLEQRLELNTEGTSNTITSVQKDNLVLETDIINPLADCDEVGWHFAQNVYDEESPCVRSVKAGGGSGNIPKVITKIEYAKELMDPDFHNFLYEIDGEVYLIRIRKLIPKECLRLMDVPEKYIERMLQVESNTNLYRAAGNSIVCNCLVAIFGQMFEGKENVYRETTL